MSGCRESSKIYSSSSENKYAQLHEFLRSGDTKVSLSLHASKVSLSSYRAWPNMHETRFALYKLPMQVSVAGQEYGGRPSADKSGKALFFLLLSYEEGKRLLIATKILEGTRYVLHPNGYKMFIVNIDDPSLEPVLMEIPSPLILNTPLWGRGKVLQMDMVLDILFVFEDGLLAFMWKESRPILTFARAFEER